MNPEKKSMNPRSPKGVVGGGKLRKNAKKKGKEVQIGGPKGKTVKCSQPALSKKERWVNGASQVGFPP